MTRTEEEALLLWSELERGHPTMSDIELIEHHLAMAKLAVWEEAAMISESKYDHRNQAQYVAYRSGAFSMDHEAAGDAIAVDLREQREKEILK